MPVQSRFSGEHLCTLERHPEKNTYGDWEGKINKVCIYTGIFDSSFRESQYPTWDVIRGNHPYLVCVTCD